MDREGRGKGPLFLQGSGPFWGLGSFLLDLPKEEGTISLLEGVISSGSGSKDTREKKKGSECLRSISRKGEDKRRVPETQTSEGGQKHLWRGR